MTRLKTIGAAIVILAAGATPARADITAFAGVTTAPSNRTVVGGALGVTLLVVGFEGEFARTRDDPDTTAPALTTGSGNVFVQNPIPIGGFTLYATAGAGLYHEQLGSSGETNVAVNTGVGAKIELVSHVRLRVDYRVFRLSGAPRNPTPKRIYLGLNLAL